MAKKRKSVPASATSGQSSSKQIKDSGVNPTSFDKMPISWQFQLIDFDGPWGWSNHQPEAIWEIIHDRLCKKEDLNWNDLKSSGSHNVELHKLIKRARDRLKQIKQNDLDSLFSLRLSGTERIWGIRDRCFLKILWFDPTHEVCPSKKKHT
jgi:hypothetical protein